MIEAVFVASLAGTIAPAPLLAAVLAYRATYYLFPLVLAIGGYVLVEAKRTKGNAQGNAKGGPAAT
ncbi:MAG: hypothetical protein U1F25_06880 [Rubrivivax sp.]